MSASLGSSKPYPLRVVIPTGTPLYVSSQLGSVGEILHPHRGVIYRYKRGGRFLSRAMVDGMTQLIEGNPHPRRVYVDWRTCQKVKP